MAGALFLEGTSRGHGLGLAGAIVINLCGASVLAALLVLDAGPPSRRGRIVVWLIVVLATGWTVGDHVVQLRFAGGPLPVGLARLLRFAGGIGGYLLLAAVPGVWGFVASVFAALSVILALTTRGHRGLPGLLSGQRLTDARQGEDPDAAPPGAAPGAGG